MKHRVKIDAQALLLTFALAYFSLLRSGVSFTDDTVRVITGQSYFLFAGRPIAEAFTLLLHQGKPVFDASPLSQIIGIICLVGTAAIFAQTRTNIARWPALLAASFIGLNPMIIENMAYKFDAGPMCIALALAIIPHMLYKPGWKHFAVTSGCLFLSLMAYQAAIGAFVAMVAGGIVVSILGQEAPRLYFGKLLGSIAALGLAALAYKLVVVFFLQDLISSGGWVTIHSKVANPVSIIPVAIQNTTAYFHFIWSIFSGSTFGKLAAIAVVGFFFRLIWLLITQRRTKQLSFEIPVLIISLFILFISPIGLQIVLVSPVMQPRSLYGLGVVMAIMASISLMGLKENVSSATFAAPWLCLAATSMVMASLFGNMQQAQDRWESIIEGGLANNIAQIALMRGNKFQFYGNAGYAPEVKIGIARFPIFRYIARYYLGNIWSFPARLSSLGLPIEIVHELDANSPEQIRSKLRDRIAAGVGYQIFSTDKDYSVAIFGQ